jgi:hypothetical protein
VGLFDLFSSEERRRDAVAVDIDVDAGVLHRCDICRAVYDRGGDARLPAADALAHELFERNDPRVAVFKGNREDLLRRLRSARKPIPYGCICENTG